MAKKKDDNIWNTFSYLSTNQKRSILELTNVFETSIKSTEPKKEEYIFDVYDLNLDDNLILTGERNHIIRNADLKEEKNIEDTIEFLEHDFDKFNLTIDQLENIIKSIEQFIIKNQDMKESADTIKSINSETYLLMNNLRANYDHVNWFISELEEIDKIQDIKQLKIDDFNSISSLLDSIDRSSNLMSKCEDSFTQYSYYTKILNNIRNLVLNSYEKCLEKIVLNAASFMLHKISHGTETSYSDFISNFKSYSANFKKYVLIIEPHTEVDLDYQRFFVNVFQNYTEIRQKLVSSLISNSFSDVTSNNKSINSLELTRVFCKLLMNICQSEYDLIIDYFGFPPKNISNFINLLTILIYDKLLPYLVKVSDIDSLCELISLFSNELLIYPIKDNDKLWWDIYSNTINQMRQDVTGRVIFKVEDYISKNILNYNISENYLYTLNKEISNSEDSNNTICENKSKHFIFEPIKISCKLLTQLYLSLPKSLFEKIAKDCISSCIKNIENTYNTSTFKNKLKGYLFVIRYLLIIREEMTSYDVDFITKEIVLEFGDIKKATQNIFKNRSNLLSLSSNNALLQFFIEGAPRLNEKWIDSKKEVELKIRSYCFNLINMISNMLLSIPDEIYQKLKEASTEEILVDENKSPEYIKRQINEFYSYLLTKYVEIKKTFSAYLENSETEAILLKPIKINVMNCYKSMYTHIQLAYSDEAKMIMALPLVEQISLIMN